MSTVRNKPLGYFEKILAIDCETTGYCINTDDPSYNPQTGERHQAISWGIIIANANTLLPIEKLYLEVKWNLNSIEAREKIKSFGKKAETIHGLTIEHLEKHGVEEEDAVTEIGNLILNHFADGNIRTLGHNVATFDLWFLKDLFRRHDIYLKFGNRHIDTSSLGFVNFGVYTSDQLFDECGFKLRGTHNALSDIEMTLEAARIMRIIFQSALK